MEANNSPVDESDNVRRIRVVTFAVHTIIDTGVAPVVRNAVPITKHVIVEKDPQAHTNFQVGL